MPQKKKQKKKEKKPKTTRKPHSKQVKTTIIQQAIPNYSSGQMTGHQYNKDHVQFVPQQQQSHTDNIVGELVGRLMNKIENNENKEVQQYTKEVQPINNNNENTSNINIYNNVPGTTESKKPDATPQTPDNPGDNAISDGIKNAARTATEDFFLNAGSGLAAIAGAALGTSGWRNRKAIRNSISNIPTNARNSLGSIRERFRGSSAYRPQVDVPSPAVSVPASRRPSNASNQAASIAGSRRPSNASTASSQNSLLSGSSQEGNIIDNYMTAIGISPERSARAARIRSNSTSSRASVNYREGGGTNLIEQFDNTSASRASVKKKSGLDTEQRTLLEQTLKKQGLDPTNLSPINQDLLRGRPSGIQQRDIGASTRTVRAQTGEPHAQLQTPARGRGRPRTNEYARPIGPARPVGRPQTNEYARPIGPARLRGRPPAAQAEEAPQAQTRTQARQPVTRNVGTKKK